ncbi:MAG: SdrD B-like domain-containing protein, partial [Candidatus Krumholzibacteriota bacterium]
MTPKNSIFSGGLTLKLAVLALTILGLGLTGCSEDNPLDVPAGNNDSATGVFRVDVTDDNLDFEIISTKNGDPANPIEGPFSIRGRNIRYDSEMGALILDLSVKNLGDNTFDEVVTLTFLSLLPEGITVLNPDNGENGPGAAIDFEFENDDAQWAPGEESLPRETYFLVEDGISIGFIARLDTGTGGGALGSIGGLVWDDANGDGLMDEDESFIEGATLELTAEGMEAMTTETGADGTYTFNDLASGFYKVTKLPSEGMAATTPTMIYVILVLEDGQVISFLAANFGCMAEGGGELASISGVVFDDANGDGVQDEGELGLSGMRVGLQGAAILEVTSDADGAYAFADLGMGEYTVKSFGPPGWVATTPEV